MRKITKTKIANGIYWIEVHDADLRLLCGSPEDTIKHLSKRGFLNTVENNGTIFESGPNAILLSDKLIQNSNISNLAEFPILQMLYRQGMIIPNHPNNNGQKPILIGSRSQIESQLNYIYRGNYGLSLDEMLEIGIPLDLAKAYMEIKLFFAFGKIRDSKEFLEAKVLENQKLEIKNGVFIRRIETNIFEIEYLDETTIINLNLSKEDSYESPYPLGFYNIKREFFAVIHSGQGDGWGPNTPGLSSLIVFQGRIYLIDAGPNIEYVLKALGIGINEIDGLFHTHAHDDHFAGIASLLKSDKKIKYYSTSLVRYSVMKKFSALTGLELNRFYDFFDVYDLKINEWNNIDGLEVKPVYSPHPIETNTFSFRTLWADGYKSYSHLADIASFEVLDKIESNCSELAKELCKDAKNEYLSRVDIKKIDIGGGLIHGDARDFKKDSSKKIILAHISREFTNTEKEIGSGAHFGAIDILIPAKQNYLGVKAYELLRSYFPSAKHHQLSTLLNGEYITFLPETIIIREQTINDEIYLILSGSVERVDFISKTKRELGCGAIIGEISGLIKIPSIETYRSSNYVNALSIPASLFLDFVKTNSLYSELEQLKDAREFLMQSALFGDKISYLTHNEISKKMKKICIEDLDVIKNDTSSIKIIKKGTLTRVYKGRFFQTLKEGEFFGEDRAIFNDDYGFKEIMSNDLELYCIPIELIKNIPIVNWKLYENYTNIKQEIEALQNRPY